MSIKNPTWDETQEVAPSWDDTTEEQSIGDILSRPEPFVPIPESASTVSQFVAPGEELSLGRELKEAAFQPEFFVPGSLPTAKGDDTILGPPSAALYNTFVKGTTDFLNTPAGLLSLGVGALPAWGQRLAALAFGTQMTKAAAEKAGEASVTHDPQTAFEAAFTALPVPFLAKPSVSFGSNIALTPRDTMAIAGRELGENVAGSELPITPTEPLRQLGVQPPINQFFNPGVRDIAGRALEEAQNRAILEPGAEPALQTLRREFNPPQIQEIINATKAEPLGGQVSFNAPAEARAVPSARQSASEVPNAIQPETTQSVRSLREPPRESQGEVPAPKDSGPVDAGRSEVNATKTPNEIDALSALGPDEFNQAIKDSGIGLTSSAYRLAERLTTEDIPALEAAQKKAHEARKELTKGATTIDQLQKGVALGMKGQMFNEAIKWRKALDEAKATEASMQQDFAALERKYGVGESMRYGGDLQAAFERENPKPKPEPITAEAELQKPLGSTTHRQIVSMADAEVNKLFSAKDETGKTRKAPHTDAVAYGIKHGPEIVPALEKIVTDSTKAAEKAVEQNNNEAFQAAFGRMTWANGAIEGALKKGPNYDLFTKTKEIPKVEESPMEVEGVTSLDPASGVALSATDALINKLEGLKFAEVNEGRLYSLPHPDAIKAVGKSVWNTGIDMAIASVKAGRAIGDAVNEAISYIKKNASGFDENKIRQNLESILKMEEDSKSGLGGASKSSASGAAVLPSKSVPSNKGGSASQLSDIYKIFEPEKKQGSSLKEKAVNVVEAVRTGVSSKFRPLNRLAEDIAKAYGRTSSKDIAGIMEQLKGSQGRGEADIYRFDRAVSDLVKGDEKDFNAYMFLKRGLDRLNQDIKDGQGRRKIAKYSIEDLQSKLATLEQKLGPEKLADFEKAAEGYQDFMDQSLRLQVESGRMSPEVYKAIKEGNQFYAPFKVMKYLEESSRPPGTGARIDTPADYTKAMEGIEDPNFKLGDMLGAARQNLLISRILSDKNLAMRNVAELAAFDSEGRFIKKLGPKEEAPRGSDVVNVFENGEQSRYATRPEVAEALQTYTGTANSLITRFLSRVGNLFRFGATAGNIPFQISNLMADIPRQALVSKYGLRGVTDIVRYPLDFVHSLLSSVAGDVFGKHSKLFQDFLDSGTAGVTVQEHLTPNALKFVEPTSISKSKALAKTVINTLPNFATAIEQTSKIVGVKRAMRIEGVESGAQLRAQIPEAITEIRRFSGSPDFGRQGKWVEQARLNLLYMFLNARIQGAVADIGRLTGRDGASTAARTWFKVGTAVGIPTAYLWALNHRPQYREDYEKRPQQEKDNYWLIPKDHTITTEDGEVIRDYWRIPKREMAKWVANLTESSLHFADKKDPKSAAHFAQQLLEDITPVNIQGDTAQERLESVGASLNPVIKAPLELATGRDMYRHRDLIPDTMKKASPELQFTKQTAEVFKKVSELIPDVAPEVLRSPIILENLTRNFTAALFTQILPRRPVEGRSGIENNPLLQRFQALPYTDNEEFKQQMKELERESADEYLIRHRQAQALLDAHKGEGLGAAFKEAPKDMKLLKHVVDLWVARRNGATSKDQQLLALPAKQRAGYIAHHLSGMTPEQKTKAILDFSRKRILTEAVFEELPGAMKGEQ